MNILIINLTRFGDLLQTQPVILGLKAQGHRVGLLCLSNFATALPLLREVDHAFTLKGSSLLAKLDTDWYAALGEIDQLLDKIGKEFPVDMVCNTTATLAARLLTRRLTPQGMRIMGFGVDDDGFGISGDVWTTFLQGSSTARDNCPFNIVDLFRATAGLGATPSLSGLCPPALAMQKEAQTFLHQRAPEGTRGYVCFQLGASEAKRQWAIAHFAEVGARLWNDLHMCPVILGSPAEQPLAQEYAQAAQYPYIDAVGQTSIPLLAAVLAQSRLLITNDTGTMHLAAGIHTPVLGIFLATAQPWDTGPYSDNCCCLEPNLACHPCPFGTRCPHDNACQQHISSDTVYTLARGFLTQQHWKTLPATGDVRAWQTYIDASGFASVRSISGHEREERTQRFYIQRQLYRHCIDRLNGTATPPLRAQDIYQMDQPLCQDLIRNLQQGCELLHLLGEQITAAMHMPRSPLGQRVLATNSRICDFFQSCKTLAVLGHLWMTLAQERGGNLQQLQHMAQELRHCFEEWVAVLLVTR